MLRSRRTRSSPIRPLAFSAGLVLMASAATASGQYSAVSAPAGRSGLPAPFAVDSATLAAIRWRSIGPAIMGGRITDIEGIPSPSRTFYVAAATGGIWKTTNAGTTFRPVFDHERVVSMGDIAIAPSDTNVVYAGTGEEDSRNSISPGGGVYKTTDGGKTWHFIGLGDTQQIGRIVVDPRDANVAYVAALGHAWGPNKERGLYKTTDGGRTWRLAKFISDRAGFVDVAIDPSNPNTLFASSWERVRGPYFLKSGGPGSALWKSTDAGATWTKISGGGFPTTTLGRIGIAIAPSNPRIVYALVEADSLPNPRRNTSPTGRQKLLNGLYRSTDGGTTWTRMNDRDTRPFYYSQVRVDARDPDRVYWSSTPFQFSDDGGKTVRTGARGIHVDDHALWIDPNDPAHFILGDDGGIAQSWDRGGNFDFINTIPLGQFYDVSFDMGIPYNVCGGLQDNGSWCGPSRRRTGAITNAMWSNVGGGDGFYTAQDPTNPNIIYSESQNGGIGRLDYSTGQRVQIRKPSFRERYRQFEDSIVIARGDTTQPEPPAMARTIAALRARQKTDSSLAALRFNWETPFILSPHSPSTLYIGGNRVLKSTDRGDHLMIISPDLSTRDSAAIRTSMETTGGITRDATGAEQYGTVTTLAESPVRPGLLYAGTDDGNVWLTRNDGATWENLTGRFPGLPKRTWVSRIEPSAADTSTFYVAFDGHRTNDFTPYLYVTTDFGHTFRSIAAGLPRGGPDYIHVVREDPVNRDLLFVGTDVGAYVSLDRGQTWQRFTSGLPTVPVYDLKIHPRDHEIIAGTHGRSIWIAGIAPLEQMKDAAARSGTHLFVPDTAYEFGSRPIGGEAAGQKTFQGQNLPYGAALTYRIATGTTGPVTFTITSVAGDTLRTLDGTPGPGMRTVYWDFRPRRTTPLSPSQRRDSVVFTHRLDTVIDSLARTGVPRAALDKVRKHLLAGGPAWGGNAFSGVAPGQRFVERPAESPLPFARDTTRAANAPLDFELVREVYRAVVPEGTNLQWPLRGEQPPLVPTGDYLVTMTAGGRQYRQTLRVERVSGDGDARGGMDSDDDN